jgi:hypothetical protein
MDSLVKRYYNAIAVDTGRTRRPLLSIGCIVNAALRSWELENRAKGYFLWISVRMLNNTQRLSMNKTILLGFQNASRLLTILRAIYT